MNHGKSEKPKPEVISESNEEPGDDIEEIDPFDMITGEDVSRLPETTKPVKKEETAEEEKPSYAQIARSRPTSECNPDEPVVDDEPVVQDCCGGCTVEDPVV